MTYDDPYDDEDWYDDEDELDDQGAAHCPECGGPVHSLTGKCPECGYWLSAADRRQMWFSESKPAWLRIAAVILLLAFLAGVLAAMGIL